jgi:hypothetical protein
MVKKKIFKRENRISLLKFEVILKFDFYGTDHLRKTGVLYFPFSLIFSNINLKIDLKLK